MNGHVASRPLHVTFVSCCGAEEIGHTIARKTRRARHVRRIWCLGSTSDTCELKITRQMDSWKEVPPQTALHVDGSGQRLHSCYRSFVRYLSMTHAHASVTSRHLRRRGGAVSGGHAATTRTRKKVSLYLVHSPRPFQRIHTRESDSKRFRLAKMRLPVAVF